VVPAWPFLAGTLRVPAAVGDRFHGEYGEYGEAGAGRDDDIVARSCAKGGAEYCHERPQQREGSEDDGRREVALAPAKRRIAGQGCQNKEGVGGVDGEHRFPGAGVGLDTRVMRHDISAHQRDHGSEQDGDQPGAPASSPVIGLAVVYEPGPAGRGPEASQGARAALLRPALRTGTIPAEVTTGRAAATRGSPAS
jgi:hypothetical protein